MTAIHSASSAAPSTSVATSLASVSRSVVIGVSRSTIACAVLSFPGWSVKRSMVTTAFLKSPVASVRRMLSVDDPPPAGAVYDLRTETWYDWVVDAIRTLAAIGGSTNAVIHLIAIAGRLGLKLSVDDFGDSATSLASLTQFPLDAVKLHPTLTARLPGDEKSLTLVQGTIDLAHKDLSLILGAAHAAQVPMPVAAAVFESYSLARANGCGANDFSAMTEARVVAHFLRWAAAPVVSQI